MEKIGENIGNKIKESKKKEEDNNDVKFYFNHAILIIRIQYNNRLNWRWIFLQQIIHHPVNCAKLCATLLQYRVFTYCKLVPRPPSNTTQKIKIVFLEKKRIYQRTLAQKVNFKQKRQERRDKEGLAV